MNLNNQIRKIVNRKNSIIRLEKSINESLTSEIKKLDKFKIINKSDLDKSKSWCVTDHLPIAELIDFLELTTDQKIKKFNKLKFIK